MDTRTVQRLLEREGKQAADFHRLQLENLDEPLEAVQMDEMHGKLVSFAFEGTVKRKDIVLTIEISCSFCLPRRGG